MAKKKPQKVAPRRQPKVLSAKPKAIALAALYISESMLLELHAAEILSAKDIRGLLKDAATTLLNANTKEGKKTCQAASEIVNSICQQFEGRPRG